MTGLCVMYLGLPLVVIGQAVTETVLMILASGTGPRSRAFTKALGGSSHNLLGHIFNYLAVQLQSVKLQLEAASTSITQSTLISSNLPQHRKARRKRRNAVSYRYLKFLSATCAWQAVYIPCGATAKPRRYVPRAASTDLWERIVTRSSLAPPSDTCGFWNPPWDTSPATSPLRHVQSASGGGLHHWRPTPDAVSDGNGINSEWDPVAFLTPPPLPSWRNPPIACLATTHRSAPPTTALKQKEALTFDTDSAPVGIDNRCSVCMSHVKSDFIGELQEARLAVTGFHGTKHCKVYKGTIHWRLEDDHGSIHDICIPGSYYVPDGKHRLISPQHWAQKAAGESSCLTLHDRAILTWNDGRVTKTVPIDSQNVFTFDLAPGYRNFSAVCMQAKYDHGIHDHAPEIIHPEQSSGMLPNQQSSSSAWTSSAIWITKPRRVRST
jgi:hypothetical protein